jgi:hypothetical protein
MFLFCVVCFFDAMFQSNKYPDPNLNSDPFISMMLTTRYPIRSVTSSPAMHRSKPILAPSKLSNHHTQHQITLTILHLAISCTCYYNCPDSH